MRLMTWNINSVRLRLPLLLEILADRRPDIACLQETKCPDEVFPLEPLREAGYINLHINGMKSYNGVAILSRIPLESADIYHRVGKQDCRHICARASGVEIHNLYIPAGGDLPDPVLNDKFAHKLAFVDEMAQWFAAHIDPSRPVIALGDFNIAPLEHDVWSHRQLRDVVSHTPVEIEKLEAMRKSANWIDVSRRFVPESEKCYTWWSYRARDWAASDRGRRLDHVWTTPALGDSLKGHEILWEVRGAEKASDHVPVIVDLAV